MLGDRSVRRRDVNELLHIHVPAVAAPEHRRAEEQTEVLIRLPAVGLDAPAVPLSSQPELIPGADVASTTFVLGAEYGFELSHREPPDRIVGVHEYHVSVVEEARSEAARGNLHARGWIALCALERGGGGRIDLLAKDGEIARAREKRPDGRGSAVHPVLELHFGLQASESIGPRLHELAQKVMLEAAVPPHADRSRGLLLRHVERQRIDEVHGGLTAG